MYIKECRICGKQIVTEHKRKCLCSEECRLENNKQLARKHNERRRQIERTVKPTAKKKPSVVDIAVKAREAGMTYGQYTAMLYMQEGRCRSGKC